jgi:hypothetical protein
VTLHRKLVTLFLERPVKTMGQSCLYQLASWVRMVLNKQPHPLGAYLMSIHVFCIDGSAGCASIQVRPLTFKL